VLVKEISYNILKPWLSLDDWQKEYINTEGNCFLLCGRQSGKSTAMSIKFGTRAATRPNRKILMIAYTENQAYALFFKTLMFLQAKYPKMIRTGNKKPTRHEIYLTNDSQISCYAAGISGDGLRHHTLTDLAIDEAAPMSREVFVAVSPMLSITGGSMDISSTPRGKQGYFYDASQRPDFKKFYISAEDCPRHKKEFLEAERKSMSALYYAQEYQAQFLDDLKQMFPDELVKKVMTLPKVLSYPSGEISAPGRSSSPLDTSLPGDYYLGVDLARLGEDKSVFISCARRKKRLRMVDMIITEKTRLTESFNTILEATKKYNYKKIYIDSAGVGGGVFDFLLREDLTKKKIVSIENASKPLDKDEKSKKKILKEDLYRNLLILMEQGKIDLWLDPDLAHSLKSVQYEYEEKSGRVRIFGNDTHAAEALIRAAWCMTKKELNIWCG